MSTFNFFNVFDLWSEENWKNNKCSAVAVLATRVKLSEELLNIPLYFELFLD